MPKATARQNENALARSVPRREGTETLGRLRKAKVRRLEMARGADWGLAITTHCISRQERRELSGRTKRNQLSLFYFRDVIFVTFSISCLARYFRERGRR